MSKAVILSIQPKWCELIASMKKTIEVRKTAPKLETPFKCYIYQTRRKWIYRILEKIGLYRGKVIGEFVCDNVEAIACHKYNNGVGFDYTYYTESKDTLTKETQLADCDMQQYLGHADDGECVGYCWHISDLVIYDKPRELGEFNGKCKIEGWHCCTGTSPLARPPQSWCYVEEN